MSLIERLKAWAENYSANRYPAELMAEAAARIETLEAAIETNTKALGFAQNGRCAADARIEALETALKPFAKMAGHPVMFVSTASSRVQVDTNDFRRAADLLASSNLEKDL